MLVKKRRALVIGIVITLSSPASASRVHFANSRCRTERKNKRGILRSMYLYMYRMAQVLLFVNCWLFSNCHSLKMQYNGVVVEEK